MIFVSVAYVWHGRLYDVRPTAQSNTNDRDLCDQIYYHGYAVPHASKSRKVNILETQIRISYYSLLCST